MRSISSLLALLLVIGVVLASTVLVSKIVTTQVGRSSSPPSHLQVIDKSIVRISSRVYRVAVTFYNPSDRVFKVYPGDLILYTNGFRYPVSTSIIDGNPIILAPGETGKLEVIGKSIDKVETGVTVLTIYVEDTGRNTGYRDTIIIPLR